MEMEFMAEFTEGMSRDRARQIIRGKRTKRNRTSSPFALSTTSGNYSDCIINNFTSDQSPVMSSEMSTEEDEDMANCLIMLAQSVSPVKEEKFKFKSDQIRQKTEKLSSRRFTEMTPAVSNSTAGGIGIGIGKSGVFVYECKTCNRTFPSFQALGGHRASHKKPKVNVEEKKSGSQLTEYSDEDQQQQIKLVVEEDEENKSSLMIISNNVQKSPSSSSSPGFIQIINDNNTTTKGKVHECSICGSEFLSGQALGGHMRKHRPTPPAINRTGISTNTDDSTTDQHIENSPGGNMLSLDLNLPAPEMADDVQSQFQFNAGSSQSQLVFSAPVLVDCHY